MRKTVSLYLEETKWETVKELGFNMSDEVDKLMDLLIATSMDFDDPGAKKVTTRKQKLEKEMKLIEQRQKDMADELDRVTAQEKVYKAKVAQIEENKQFSKLIREFNRIISKNDYSLKNVMADPETSGMLEKLSEYEEDWTEVKVLQQINRVRKYMEGF